MGKTLILEFVIFLFIFLNFLIFALKGGPFVPTPKKVIREALKLANLKRGEILYDLGAGTGNVLIIGEKEFGARVVGFEFSPILFFLAKLNFLFHRIKGKIYFQNFFNSKINDANVIFLFLTPKILEKLKKKLKKELKPGTRIVCFSSPIPSWQPAKILPLKETKNKINLYLYII
jgi:SAM-dependent methyltransferase